MKKLISERPVSYTHLDLVGRHPQPACAVEGHAIGAFEQRVLDQQRRCPTLTVGADGHLPQRAARGISNVENTLGVERQPIGHERLLGLAVRQLSLIHI